MKIKQHGHPDQLERKRQNLKERMELSVGFKNITGSALKAKKVVFDLVSKPEVRHLNRNLLANLETIISFLEQIVNFKRDDIKKLEEIASMDTRGNVSAARATATSGLFGTAATRFINQFYTMLKDPTAETRWNSIDLIHIIEREVRFLFNWIATNAKSPSEQMVEEVGFEWRRTVIFAQLVEFLLIVTNKRKKFGLLFIF